jgi:hypothetical protein
MGWVVKSAKLVANLIENWLEGWIASLNGWLSQKAG